MSTTKVPTVTIEMSYERETKNFARYNEVTDDDTRRPMNFYLPIEQFEAIGTPDTITVTIQAG